MARRLSSVAVVVVLAMLSRDALAQRRADPQGASAGAGQAYPARPIRIIVPNTAGSAMDNVTRLIGQRLTELWGQQTVVDDRPGAGGIIGHELAAKAAPDGYTLLFSIARRLADQGL